jgi:hypothetical protein
MFTGKPNPFANVLEIFLIFIEDILKFCFDVLFGKKNLAARHSVLTVDLDHLKAGNIST